MLLPGRLCPPVAAAGYRRERTLDVCRKRYIERSGQPELPRVETHGWDLNPGPLSHQEVTASCDASVLSRRYGILPRGSRMLQCRVRVPHAGPARKEKKPGPYRLRCFAGRVREALDALVGTINNMNSQEVVSSAPCARPARQFALPVHMMHPCLQAICANG